MDDKVLSRIQGLLARRDHHNTNEHEAAVCASKIQEILLKYGLEMADILAHGTDQAKAQGPKIGAHVISMQSPKGEDFAWCLGLSYAVALSTMCKTYYYSKLRLIEFIGEETNAKAACELYNFLAWQIENACHQYVFNIPSVEGLNEGQTRVATLGGRRAIVPLGWYRRHGRNPDTKQMDSRLAYRSFFRGAVQRISARLQETMKDLVQQTAGATALVRVHDAAIDEFIAENVKTSKRKPKEFKHDVDVNAFHAGQLAGDSAELTVHAKLSAA